MSKAVVFDIAHRFLKRMLSDEQDRSPDYYARLAYELDISPKLLQFNPALNRSINGLGGGATLNHVLDWSIRDWLEYHHNYIDQGYRYGTAHLQQVWMGRPILKTPLDCWMYQEIIHSVKPDIIIELGVKFGGSSNSFCYSVSKFASELLPKLSKTWVAKNVLSNVVRIGVTKTRSMHNVNTRISTS